MVLRWEIQAVPIETRAEIQRDVIVQTPYIVAIGRMGPEPAGRL